MSKVRTFRRPAATVAAACGLSLLALPASAGASAAKPLVRTSDGPVRGFVEHGTNTFLGVPYAAAPVGDLRWRPPRPHRSWHRPLRATAFGPSCPQVTTLGVFAGPTSVNEDCLYLNVFTTGGDRSRSARKPVLVWIHGGGNVDRPPRDYDRSKPAPARRHRGQDTLLLARHYRPRPLRF